MRERGLSIGNIDSTVIAQAPRLAPHIAAMRERIASVLDLPADCVNVKAKTAEQLGPVGQGLAIEARAIAGARASSIGFGNSCPNVSCSISSGASSNRVSSRRWSIASPPERSIHTQL